MALGFIGTRAVAGPSERTPEARQCELYWDRARRAALRDFPYPFSKRRIRLARLEVSAVDLAEWSYAYAVPVEALKVLSVGDGAKYELMQGQNGTAIYTDVADAVAVCVVDVEDMALWDELFIMAMAYRLAMLIAVPLLKNNPQKIQELAALYQQALPSAQGHAANEARKTNRRTAIAGYWQGGNGEYRFHKKPRCLSGRWQDARFRLSFQGLEAGRGQGRSLECRHGIRGKKRH